MLKSTTRDGERSQGVKAVDCGSTTRGFESRRSPLIRFFCSSKGWVIEPGFVKLDGWRLKLNLLCSKAHRLSMSLTRSNPSGEG